MQRTAQSPWLFFSKSIFSEKMRPYFHWGLALSVLGVTSWELHFPFNCDEIFASRLLALGEPCPFQSPQLDMFKNIWQCGMGGTTFGIIFYSNFFTPIFKLCIKRI